MSTSSEITRLTDARNTIRDKLVDFGVASPADRLDDLADEIDDIPNRGAVYATLATGDTYTIPAGYHNGSGVISTGGNTSDLENLILAGYAVEADEGDVAITKHGADGVPAADVAIDIVPYQSGSGEPWIISNERPITGWTSIHMCHSGFNMLDNTLCESGSIGANGTVTASDAWKHSQLIPVHPGMEITFSGDYDAYDEATMRVHGYDQSGAWSQQLGYMTCPSRMHFSINILVPAGIFAIAVSYQNTSYNVMLAAGPEDRYADYHGVDQTVYFGKTIYHGAVDVDAGLLLEKSHSILLDGNADVVLDANRSTTDVILFYIATFGDYGVMACTSDYTKNILSSSMPVVDKYANLIASVTADRPCAATGWREYDISDGRNWIYIALRKSVYTTITDAASFKTFLASHNMQFVFQLDTPIETQLVIADAGFQIVQQPNSYVGPLNGTATFTIGVNDDSVAYQWQYINATHESWTNTTTTGSQTASLSYSATEARSQNLYRCKVTKDGTTLYSAPCTITIEGTTSTRPALDYTPNYAPFDSVVNSFLGGNMIWSDAGESHAVFRCDPTLIENKLLDATYDSYPHDATSGAIASILDGADHIPVRDLTINIDAVQAGTGTPSLSNIRRIVGRTGALIGHIGSKNWWSIPVINQYNGAGIEMHIPPGVYVMSFVRSRTSSPTLHLSVRFIYRDGTSIVMNTSNGASVELTAHVVAINYAVVNYSSGDSLSNIQLQLGQQATDYEPFVGETFDLSWESYAHTVYGGSISLPSKKMVFNRIYAVSNADGNFDIYNGPFVTTGVVVNVNAGSGAPYAYINLGKHFDHSATVTSLCDQLVWESGNGVVEGNENFKIRITSSVHRITFRMKNISGWGTTTDTATVQTAVTNYLVAQYQAGTPMQFAITLDTPIVAYLPEDVSPICTYVGTNNFWADSGNTALDYRADPTIYGSQVFIIQQPTDYTGAIGATATFTVGAIGTGDLSYRWYRYVDNAWIYTTLTGATTATLSFEITASRAEVPYRCCVTNAAGKEVYSNSVNVIVPS